MLAQELTEPVQSDVQWVLLAGLLQPLVVALLTKKNASPGMLRVANVLLAGLVGAANALYEDQQNGGAYDWKRAMVVAVGVWLASATAYVHLWKDTTALKKVDDATANFGVGTRDAGLRLKPVTEASLVEALGQAQATQAGQAQAGTGSPPRPGEPSPASTATLVIKFDTSPGAPTGAPTGAGAVLPAQPVVPVAPSAPPPAQ